MLGQIVEDRYLVEQVLGAGAMGHVYRARHVKVGRSVAIKVMHADLARKPIVVERFAREARIAARLAHPNLVGVVDVGVTPGPERLPLLVLELAPGRALTEYTHEPMASERVVDIIRQLLQGLAHAHRAGLVHRDLKPDNILVEERHDGEVIPRIVDFGIAVCDASDDPIAGSRLTEANTIIGTPTYMSPEQAMAKPLDARSDLFSLGVVMYELLAGVPPFTGEAMEVAYASVTKDAPSIAERTGIAVDPLLDAFARTLMARRLDERFASADAALAMLDLIERDRLAATRALAARMPAPSMTAQHGAEHDERSDDGDLETDISCERASRRERSLIDRSSEQMTRVEHVVGMRPARARALMACGLAVATLVAIVGWSASTRTHAASASVAAAGTLEAPHLQPPTRRGAAGTPSLAATPTAPAPAASHVARSADAASRVATTTTAPASVSASADAASSRRAIGVDLAATGAASSRRPTRGDVAAVLAAAREPGIERGPANERESAIERELSSNAPAHAPVVEVIAAAATPPAAGASAQPSAQNVVDRYVAVGRSLRGTTGDAWTRYRLIRINDALATEASRTAALATLAEIERSLAR